jgi:DNA-binding response OmpR family regulator
MPRVVVIDADEAKRRRIAAAVASAGFETLEASGTVEGLLQVLDSGPDLIVLAEEMPPLQAADLLVVLRRASDAPIIVIGEDGEPEEVAALESGADSYVRRRASRRLLMARVNAVLRRYPGRNDPLASLTPTPIPISLTVTERRLLARLSNHSGRPVGLNELRVEVWGGRVGTCTVRYYLRRLKRKLKREQYGLELLCIRGVGYHLVPTQSQRPTRAAASAAVVPPERRCQRAGVA